jgi:hypothetical protein
MRATTKSVSKLNAGAPDAIRKLSWPPVTMAYEAGIGTADHGAMDGEGRTFIDEPLKKNEWHRNMCSKYRRAASYPWLRIEPDPPEPE